MISFGFPASSSGGESWAVFQNKPTYSDEFGLRSGVSLIHPDWDKYHLDPPSRAVEAKNLEVARVAIDSFEIFTGFRKHIRRAESIFNTYSKRLYLTGHIKLKQQNQRIISVDEEIKVVGTISKFPENGSFSSLDAYLPSKLSWSFSMDFKETAFSGIFKLGEHVYINGLAGQNVKMSIFWVEHF